MQRWLHREGQWQYVFCSVAASQMRMSVSRDPENTTLSNPPPAPSAVAQVDTARLCACAMHSHVFLSRFHSRSMPFSSPVTIFLPGSGHSAVMESCSPTSASRLYGCGRCTSMLSHSLSVSSG